VFNALPDYGVFDLKSECIAVSSCLVGIFMEHGTRFHKTQNHQNLTLYCHITSSL